MRKGRSSTVKAMLFLAAMAVAVGIGAQSSAGVPSGQSEMTWTDTGQRNAGTFAFTAAPPLCPSGTVRDVGGTVGIKMQHTCADGSGSFEFEVIGTGHFHFSAAGTGRYATLRGTGSCSLTENDDGTFIRSCHALADFDSTAPTAAFKTLDVLLAGRRFNLQAAFGTTDNVAGNAVKYRVSVSAAGRALGHTTGTTPGGIVRATVRGRLPKHAHRLAVSIRVVDPLGNARTVTRSVRIRH
jgi:hypothetical protein